MELTAQLPLDPDFHVIFFFLGGANGVALKSNIPCSWACADNLRLM